MCERARSRCYVTAPTIPAGRELQYYMGLSSLESLDRARYEGLKQYFCWVSITTRQGHPGGRAIRRAHVQWWIWDCGNASEYMNQPNDKTHMRMTRSRKMMQRQPDSERQIASQYQKKKWLPSRSQGQWCQGERERTDPNPDTLSPEYSGDKGWVEVCTEALFTGLVLPGSKKPSRPDKPGQLEAWVSLCTPRDAGPGQACWDSWPNPGSPPQVSNLNGRFWVIPGPRGLANHQAVLVGPPRRRPAVLRPSRPRATDGQDSESGTVRCDHPSCDRRFGLLRSILVKMLRRSLSNGAAEAAAGRFRLGWASVTIWVRVRLSKY